MMSKYDQGWSDQLPHLSPQTAIWALTIFVTIAIIGCALISPKPDTETINTQRMVDMDAHVQAYQAKESAQEAPMPPVEARESVGLSWDANHQPRTSVSAHVGLEIWREVGHASH
jgi:hypothetical protein